MNRKKGIRILLTVLTVAALLAAGGYALWKNGFFEKINSVEALREVIINSYNDALVPILGSLAPLAIFSALVVCFVKPEKLKETLD